MAISFVAATSNSSASASSSAVLDKPSGVASGDVLVLWVAVNPATFSNVVSFTAPTGWTKIRTINSYDASTNHAIDSCLMVKIADGTEGSTFSVALSASCALMKGCVAAYRGASGTILANTYGTDTDGTSPVSSGSVSNTQSTAWRITCGSAYVDSANTYAISSSESTQRAGGASWTGPNGSSRYIAGGLYDSNAAIPTGSTSKTFQHGGGGFSWRTGNVWVGILEEGGATPTTGSFSASLGQVTAAGSGEVHDDATMAMTLGSVTMSGAGYGAPPNVTGDAAMQLSSVVEDFTATQPVVGSMNMLVPVSMDFETETLIFGVRVIHVEADDRRIIVPSRGVDD